MKFECDENKSKIIKSKHGIDFEEIKKLWKDPYSFELPSSQSEDEYKFLILGQINLKNYTTIITHNGDNTRIISVRRSREKVK